MYSILYLILINDASWIAWFLKEYIRDSLEEI